MPDTPVDTDLISLDRSTMESVRQHLACMVARPETPKRFGPLVVAGVEADLAALDAALED